MKYDLTLLGFSPRSSAMLIEIAADAWGMHPAELKVQIVFNRPPEPSEHPLYWNPLHWVSLEEWTPSPSDGRIMPGVMTEPAASTVWSEVHKQKGLGFDALSVVIHPTAWLARTAEVGPGTWIHQQATVASFARIGACCTVNRNASVGHHNVMGNFSRLNPGANTAGFCQIGERVTIGVGANCRDRLIIGDGAFVGAGSVVVKNVEPGVVIIGNPGRPLEKKA